MTLRRPAAHLRTAPGWRRSGDDSQWETLIAEEGDCSSVSRTPRTPRPLSAIEGGRLDSWLKNLQRMQRDLFTVPVQDEVPTFSENLSIPALHDEPAGHAWKQPETPSFSMVSSPCENLRQRSLSQESLQTGKFSAPERRGSWQRAHIIQAPGKEHPQLSSLAPVKIGWLPIQRRVTVAGDSKDRQLVDNSANQVKLKQPITPTIQATTNRRHDEEVERSHTALKNLDGRTPQTPDQDSPVPTQVPEKRSFLATVWNRPVSWQALRRGWNTNRAVSVPGGSQFSELSTETSTDPNRKSPLIKTTSPEPLEHTLHQATSVDLLKTHTPLQGTNKAETNKLCTPLQRASSVQPLRATAPLCTLNSSSQPSHIQSSSAVTTIIPQNKAGFSSITISSRKVNRSGSVSSLDAMKPSSQSGDLPSPPLAHNQAVDPNSRQVTLQRKATIVKVTERRMMSNPSQSTESAGASSSPTQAMDTVVHRRKATIIKVIERRESYSPAKAGSESGKRHPEHRHSYIDGEYKETNTWSQESQPQLNAAPPYHWDSTKRPNTATEPSKSFSEAEKNGGTLHRSTLSLFLSGRPAIAAPAPSEVSLRSAGWRSDRPRSCYGSVCGYSEPTNAVQVAARKWSFDLPQETSINPVNSPSGFTDPPAAVKEASQLVANTLEPNGCEKERQPPENPERRMSPSITLIKAPDPHSNQSPEEVLAINAAAIIANIKLQRQLSKKKTPNINSEKDSSASPQGNSVTVDEKCARPHPDQSQLLWRHRPHAAFVPLGPDPGRSPETCSLQEALQKSRPDFISRSQCRVREMERRRQERRELAGSAAGVRQRKVHSARSAPRNDRAIPSKEIPFKPKRMVAEVKKKKEQERKKEVCLSNRQRMELFKKKLLDQILQRNNS